MVRMQLLLVAAAGVLAAQDDSRWRVIENLDVLRHYNAAPATPSLSKAIHDAAEHVLRWQPPASAAAWEKRRPEVERALRRSLGLTDAPGRSPLNAQIRATHDFGDYTLQNVVFESRPGFQVTANLYRPKGPKARRPAVLCPTGHSLDAGKRSAEVQARSIKLAKMGFVVLAYDPIGHGERLIAGNNHHEAGFALLPLGETIAGWMVEDSMRAIDYLASLEDVDPTRIGVTGNSGGGLNSLLTAALDPRVRAAVVAGYTYHFNDWIKYASAHCTCTQFPGIYREMEWFEIAGLIAPRAVLMLQGEHDSIFPVSGARIAGRHVESLYSMLGLDGAARFEALPGQPHAYSRPFRERMYGWMARSLLGEGKGEALAEGDIRPLDERDARLFCYPPDGAMARPVSVVSLARRKADELLAGLPPDGSAEVRKAAGELVRELTAPPYDEPHYLHARTLRKGGASPDAPEKIYFVSEIGNPIPGLFWAAARAGSPARVVLMAGDGGKQAVAASGMVESLLGAGYAVVSVDLRGRGELIVSPVSGRDSNFHLIKNQVLFGRPLAGRRAFDLTRAIDYLAGRKDVSLEGLAVVGLGDEALPVLLAAAADQRIRRVAAAGYVTSFLSQIVQTPPAPRETLIREWNSSAMRTGRLDAGPYDVDLGSVIPSVLRHADLPDFVSLIAPRKVLFCQVRDREAAGADSFRRRFLRVAGPAVRFAPDRPLDAELLLEWLGEGN
jgi:cephalosporin-C deacetylase-like acetyl esterase